MSQELLHQKNILSIAGHPVPVWSFVFPEGCERRKLAAPITETLDQSFLMNLIMGCRGVEAHRLPVILATGCDVEPSDSPLFASSLEKALEYGHQGNQVIQVFHHEALEISWRERSAALPDEERKDIEKDYPTVIPSIDGSSLWFTRLSPDDNRAATSYERAYGRWIPGNPAEALSALILISSDPNHFSEYFEQTGGPRA
jgi:hypothetical protein